MYPYKQRKRENEKEAHPLEEFLADEIGACSYHGNFAYATDAKPRAEATGVYGDNSDGLEMKGNSFSQNTTQDKL